MRASRYHAGHDRSLQKDPVGGDPWALRWGLSVAPGPRQTERRAVITANVRLEPGIFASIASVSRHAVAHTFLARTSAKHSDERQECKNPEKQRGGPDHCTTENPQPRRMPSCASVFLGNLFPVAHRCLRTINGAFCVWHPPRRG